MESMAEVAFYLFASVLVVSGVMVVFARNPVHSVLYLILSFFNAAGLFILLGAEFLAMLLVVVYVGAVAVLFLFVVMMLDIVPPKNGTTGTRWHRVEHLARVFLRLTGALVLYLSFSGGMIQALGWGIQISGFSESMAGIKASLYVFAGITSYAVMRYGFGISFFKVFQAFIKALPLASIPGFVILAELSYIIAHWESFGLKEMMILAPAPNPRQVTNTHALGKIIYTDYVFFLETAGLILLVAVIGAIVLTHRKREGVKRQDVRHQVARRKDDTLRLHDIPVGKGV